MIAIIWHGKTKAKDYETYTTFLKEKTKGFVKLTFLRNLKNNEAHFTLITFWENLNVIKNFAGNDFEKAKYYAEDDHFLLEFEDKVIHYEVFA